MTYYKTRFSLACLFFLLIYTEKLYAAPISIPEVALKESTSKKEPDQAETTYLTRETIKTSPVTLLSDLLKLEQSIVRVVNQAGNSSQTALSIRGFGDNAAQNSLILIDGFPLMNPSLLAPNFNAIALSDIERVDIFQGSQGTLYGDQAVGGVVNIITRHPKKWVGDIIIGLGNHNKQFYNIFTGKTFSNGLYFKTFGFFDKGDNDREHQAKKDQSLSLQGGIEYSKGRSNINVLNAKRTIEYPGGLTEAQYKTDPHQAKNFKNIGYFDTNLIQFFNQHAILDNALLETRLSSQATKGDGFINDDFNREEWIRAISTRLKGYLQSIRVMGGYEGQTSYYRLTNTRIDENAHTAQNNLFGEFNIPFLEKFEFTTGGRFALQKNVVEPNSFEENHSIQRVFVSEQGVSYHPATGWQFFMRRNGNFRFPKANEETWNLLELQKGVSYEMGGERKKDQQKTQFNIYSLQLQNEIAFNPTETPTAPFGTYYNFPETNRIGITLAESAMLTAAFEINSQLNYVNARFTEGPFSGNEIPGVPAINGNLGFRYEYISHWYTKYSALYTGKTYASEDVENSGKKQPSYWLNNIALQYIHKSLDFSFEIDNVFNQRYSVYTLFNPMTLSNTYYPGTGRSYLLTLKVELA